MIIKNMNLVVNSDGNLKHECFMDDGSVWQCDKDGENWEKARMGISELEVKFNNHLNNNK